MNALVSHADRYIELNLRECGREKCIPDKVFSFDIKNYHLFHYVVLGSGFLEMNGKKFHLRKGCLFYVPPGVKPFYYPDKEDPWTYIWLGFSGTSVVGFLEEAGLKLENPILRDRADLPLKRVFDDIYARYQEAGYLDLRCLGLAYEMFDHLLSFSPQGPEVPLSSKEKIVRGTKEFIANNYQFAISIDDIANSVGVTPNYLANIFSEAMKMSPKKYLTKMRMEKACLFLKAQTSKIKDIGALVGYKNQLHFSSEFKKSIGVSPLEYRRQHGYGEED